MADQVIQIMKVLARYVALVHAKFEADTQATFKSVFFLLKAKTLNPGSYLLQSTCSMT